MCQNHVYASPNLLECLLQQYTVPHSPSSRRPYPVSPSSSLRGGSVIQVIKTSQYDALAVRHKKFYPGTVTGNSILSIQVLKLN